MPPAADADAAETPGAVELSLLGPLEARVGGQVVDLGGLKQRAVLAVLLINANRVVSLDRLIDELWGDEPPSRATGSLQAYISNLRRALEPGRAPRTPSTVLISQAPGYSLRVDPQAVDAARFEAMAARAHRLLDGGAPEEARDLLDEALALWRGSALADFTFEPFAQAEIARLTELRASAEEDRVDAELALGHHAAVAADLETIVARYPLRERPRAQLMLALYRSGRQADALRVFAQTRAVLAEELGLEPGPALQQLEQEILQQDRSLDWSPRPAATPAPGRATPPERTTAPEHAAIEPAAATAPPPPAVTAPAAPGAPSPPAPLVGRAKQLQRIDEALDAVTSGRGRLLLLSGEPGIGKTRLAEALAERAAARGAEVAWGRSYEGEGAPAFWPWVQVLRTLTASLDGAERSAFASSALTSLVPELVPSSLQPGAAAALERDPAAARFELYEAVTGFLTRRAGGRPVVVLLDDLHWADAASLRLLQFTAGALRASHVLIVAAYRDVEVTPGHPLSEVLAAVAREPATDRIELSGLALDDVAEYIVATTGSEADRAAARDLFERTEGNPFFVTELVRLRLSEGGLAGRAGASRRSGTTAASTSASASSSASVPASVRDVIRRRLARLPEDAQALLTMAAVIGRDFPLDVLEEAAGLDGDRVLDLVETALVTGLVTDSPDALGRYRFGHALVRETLYESVSVVRRARLHAKVGHAIEQLHAASLDDHAAELAFHYFEAAPAGTAAKAVDFAVRAATRASAQLADDEAARLWEQALAALQLVHAAGPEQRFPVLLGLSRARRRDGDVVGSREAVREALQLAVDLRDPARIAEAAGGFGTETLRTWRDYSVADERVAALLERALAVVGDADSPERLRALSSLAVELSYGRTSDRADRLSREAVALARRLGDGHALAVALSARVVVVMGLPEGAEEQLEAAEQLLQLPDDAVPAEARAVGRLNRAAALLWLGRVEESLAERSRGEQAAEELKLPSLRAHVAWTRAMWALLDGRLDDAETESARAYDLYQRTSMWGGGERRFGQLYTLRREQARHAELEPPTAEMAASSQFPVFTIALALLQAEMGRLDDARRTASRATPPERNWSWLFTTCVAAELWSAIDDAERAGAALDDLRPFAGRMGSGGGGGSVCWGSVDHFIAQAATTVGRYDEAEPYFEAALAANTAAGGGPFLGRSQLAYARMLLRRRGHGDANRARALVDDAAALAVRKRLPYLAARADAVRDEVDPH